MNPPPAMTVKKVSAARFRSAFKRHVAQVRGARVVLIENRRQRSKYLVDKIWLDDLVRQRDVVQATLEVLADRKLTDRLLQLAKTIDRDVRAGKLRSMRQVFGEP
jgi:hypothetical protein